MNREPELKKQDHQEEAITSIRNCFKNITTEEGKHKCNPILNLQNELFSKNILAVQAENELPSTKEYLSEEKILDISMETGTGKTFTYTQSMFELHKFAGISKFIVILPTLPIKSGAEKFLKSPITRQFFREEYDGCELEAYVVQSKKNSKKAKRSFPAELRRWLEASNPNKIHVLVINRQLLTQSNAFKEEQYDTTLLNEYTKVFDAIKQINPVTIIDEPHRFDRGNVTWKKIEELGSQLILRFGATFNDKYENLIHRLTAVDALNNGLVKGIAPLVEQLDQTSDAIIRVGKIDNTGSGSCVFKLIENGKSTPFTIQKGGSLSRIHNAIQALDLEAIKRGTVLLSNGLELKVGDRINPYSYNEKISILMLQRAIKGHFDLEKELIVQRIEGKRIKPLTLFFIDNKENEFRDDKSENSFVNRFDRLVRAEIEERLKVTKDDFYRERLQSYKDDLSKMRAAYFAKDRSETDAVIAEEVDKILNKKEELLSLDDPCCFIFSKWTLREGWDNPNIFQICKLRSSGSTTSKLQEVGRGLRLPVNESFVRETDGEFFLNYYVDSSEADFANSLVDEINSISNFKEQCFISDEDLVKFLQEKWEKLNTNYLPMSKKDIRDKVDHLTDDNGNFLPGSLEEIKELFPDAFPENKQVNGNKVKNSTKAKRSVATIRAGKYEELKQLWEALSSKAILQYNIENEARFEELFVEFLIELLKEQDSFKRAAHQFQESRVKTKNGKAILQQRSTIENDNIPYFKEFRYGDFIKRLSEATLIKQATLHSSFCTLKKDDVINIEDFTNQGSIALIKHGFHNFLLNNSFSKFEISYKDVKSQIHPTKFTNKDGSPLKEIPSGSLGVHHDDKEAMPTYLFNEIFYDSELELEDITLEHIKEVTVFSKIPSRSIKIPVAGGKTYSPDFAYIIKTNKNEILNFVIEAKGHDDTSSFLQDEKKKIKHAEKMFKTLDRGISIKFETQLKNDKIKDIIRKALE